MFKQALQITWRDWRSGELRLLMLAVFLAVAALASVGFFANRLNAVLERDAQQLIGGDVVIVGDQPLPEFFAEKAHALGLQTTYMITFASMASTQDDGQTLNRVRLVGVKAVDDAYPLRGTMQTRTDIGQTIQFADHGPVPGEVWVAPELLVSLGLHVGEQLVLGEKSFLISRVIAIEPDGTSEGFIKLGPRVMLNMQDLESTELLQPASRANYRFAAAGEKSQVRIFEQWANQTIAGIEDANQPMRGIRMERLDTGQPTMEKTLGRAQKFLNLVALLAALLSAVAVIISARDFSRRHLNGCALLRVFGVSQKQILFFYVFEFFLAGLLAAITGVIAGYALHYVFVILLADLIAQSLPAASWLPAFYGIGIGVTLLVAFGLPPVLQLARVPPLRVLRKELGSLAPTAWAAFIFGLTGFILLLLVISQDLILGMITAGGFILAILVFAALAYILVRLLKPLADVASLPVWLRLTIRSLTAQPVATMTQVSALAIGLLALLLLFLLRTDLITSWQQVTPKDSPDRFVINILPEQAQAFEQTLHEAGINKYDWYPMILGRVMSINDKPVQLDDYDNDRSRRLVDREFSLSFMPSAPEYNEIIEGTWVAGEADALSVESGLMQSLGLKLGDRLTFMVGGTTVSGRITSVRQLDWSSMHVNFFVIFPQSQMDNVAQTYITAFKAPDDLRFDDRLSNAFPNITNINVSAMIVQIQSILTQVIKAVEFIFLFTLGAGVIVLYAAIATTREQRTHDFAIMRAMGASNALLKKVQRSELMGTGVLAGLLASVVALMIAGALAIFVFDFIWIPPLWTPLLGMLVGLTLAWLAGYLSLRSVLKQPVIQTLRVVMD